jgi:glycosyltransferase involved in cell wall biosynthesis
LLPTIVESFDLSQFDLVVSTSSCVAKGIKPAPKAKHICYLHTPMRYIWDQRHEYLGAYDKIPVLNWFIELLVKYLQRWDVKSSERVTRFIANSEFVKERVKKYYGRDATVVHPPVEVERFRPTPQTPSKDGYLLAAGAFVPYKRFDLAIKACTKLGKKLVIAGSGPMERKLRTIADKNTQFAIAPDAKEWVNLLQKAEALIFPGVEDFGMIPIECMASGTPVIAYKRGGALDYVQPGKTGEFFDEQTDDSLVRALQKYDSSKYKRESLVDFAQNFRKDRFVTSMRTEINETLNS